MINLKSEFENPSVIYLVELVAVRVGRPFLSLGLLKFISSLKKDCQNCPRCLSFLSNSCNISIIWKMLPELSSLPFLSLGLLKYICTCKNIAKIVLTSWGHLLWELQRKKFTTFEDILLLFLKLIGVFLGICICLEWPGIDIDLLPSRWVFFSVIVWSV